MKSQSLCRYSASRKAIQSVVLVTLAQLCPFILQTVFISFWNSMKISYKTNRNTVPNSHIGKCSMCLKAEKKKGTCNSLS